MTLVYPVIIIISSLGMYIIWKKDRNFFSESIVPHSKILHIKAIFSKAFQACRKKIFAYSRIMVLGIKNAHKVFINFFKKYLRLKLFPQKQINKVSDFLSEIKK